MASDWIKLHRSILESGVWADDWLLKLWIWCLIRANYADRQWKEIVIKRGQFVTGRHAAAEELGVHPSRFYRGLTALERMGNISLESNNKNTIVTVVNYESYQDACDAGRTTSEQPANNKRTTSEQPANTREEVKNLRNEEGKNNTPPNPRGGKSGSAASGKSKRSPKSLYRVEDQTYPPALDLAEFRAAWQTWTLHRQEIGHPMTPTAAAKTLAKCAAWGPSRAIAAIDHSAGNGWQGLFEPDPAKMNGHASGAYGNKTFNGQPDPRGNYAVAAAYLEKLKEEESNGQT